MTQESTAVAVVGAGGLGALAWWLWRRRRQSLDDLERIRAFYVHDLQQRFGWEDSFLPGSDQEEIFSNYLFIRDFLIGSPETVFGGL